MSRPWYAVNNPLGSKFSHDVKCIAVLLVTAVLFGGFWLKDECQQFRKMMQQRKKESGPTLYEVRSEQNLVLPATVTKKIIHCSFRMDS